MSIATAVACSRSAPTEPLWQADVAPILAANCVRCHSVPAIGGAPNSFRLDVWENTVSASGHTIFGAGTMAEFMVARAESGEMPPRELELSQRQLDTLANWLELRPSEGLAPPPGPVDEDNRAPTFELLSPEVASIEDGRVEIEYRIDDRERDLAQATLVLRSPADQDIVLASDLRGGRHRVEIDLAAMPEDDYSLLALVRDHPLRVREAALGNVVVAHDNGNTAPTVSFSSPTTSDNGWLVTDADSPVTIAVAIADADSGDSLLLTLEAVRGDERVTIADELAVASGTADVVWDTTDVTAGSGWTLVATVSDGSAQRTSRLANVTVAHGTTSLTWSDVQTLFATRCAGCHPGAGAEPRVPGIYHVLGVYDDEDSSRGVYSLRGVIYHRVIVQRTMPPASAHDLFPTYQGLTESERTRIAEWLEGGAPP